MFWVILTQINFIRKWFPSISRFRGKNWVGFTEIVLLTISAWRWLPLSSPEDLGKPFFIAFCPSFAYKMAHAKWDRAWLYGCSCLDRSWITATLSSEENVLFTSGATRSHDIWITVTQIPILCPTEIKSLSLDFCQWSLGYLLRRKSDQNSSFPPLKTFLSRFCLLWLFLISTLWWEPNCDPTPLLPGSPPAFQLPWI